MSGRARVGIVTDSTSDIPPQMAEAEGVRVVRLIATFPDGESYRDGELRQKEYFERMDRSPRLPTTSQPPVADLIAAYEDLLATCSHVVSIHISHGLSGTVEAARQVAERFGDRVRVIDSQSISWGLAWTVLFAARAARAGAAVEEVVEVAERIREKARIVVCLDRLDNLVKGGRIGKVSAYVGGLLDLKVLFTVGRDGKFEPVSRARGSNAAFRETLAYVKREMAGRATGVFAVVHALTAEKAAQLRDALAVTFGVEEIPVLETGIVVTTHTGTGWGIGFVPGESLG